MSKKRKHPIIEAGNSVKSRKIDRSVSAGSSDSNLGKKRRKSTKTGSSVEVTQTACVRKKSHCTEGGNKAPVTVFKSKGSEAISCDNNLTKPVQTNHDKYHHDKKPKMDSDSVKSSDVKKRKQGSCMKHKKHDKVHPVKRRPKKWKKAKRRPAPTSNKNTALVSESEKGVGGAGRDIPLLQSPQTISANWKQLQKKLHIKPRKQRPVESEAASPSCSTQDNTSSAKSKAEPEIWFDDVDQVLIEASKTKDADQTVLASQWNSDTNPLIKSKSFTGLTKIIAIDCEMVGTGRDGEDNMLARVSIVNQYGQCCYDKLVKPTDNITDYRTQYSGIRPGDLKNGDDFRLVQKEVADIIKGRLLVGHAINNDLKVLFLDHPRKAIRDTSRYKPFRQLFQGRTPSLKKLSDQVLGVRVQEGEHNSIQDAQATMRLYTMYRQTWEKTMKLNRKLKSQKMAAKNQSTEVTSDITSSLPQSDDNDESDG